jgi:hypothetical protein
MSNGKPATNLQPIIHAGSAWALLGLLHSTPPLAKPPQ